MRTIAYLGPKGSYTEQALTRRDKNAKGVPCFSIAEVFRQVASQQVDAGFVPLENILQGHVVETLDLLYQHKGNVQIASTWVMPINHSLGVLGAKKDSYDPSAISDIYSHSQALRQCGAFLRTQYPTADLHATPSTGSAAELVASSKRNNAAVLASKTTLEHHGFSIVADEISDKPNNHTRFALLQRKGDKVAEATDEVPNQHAYITSIVVDPGRDRKGLLFELLNEISIKNSVNLASIHSRPDTKGGFVFHIDLEGPLSSPAVGACISALERYCRDTTGDIAEIIICGSFPQERFTQLPFSSIAILGGMGAMGAWFERFFKSLGLEVLIGDSLLGADSVKNAAAAADVILLSVPMSAAKSVIEEIAPLLREDQLVVENCSVKHSALPQLIKSAPEGVEVLGIHTMFAGDREDLNSQNILITTTATSGSRAHAFESLFYKHGAKITNVSIDEHDQASALLQALTQFSLLGLARELCQSYPAVESLAPFSTPNSRNIVETIERLLKQSPELLYDLQTQNPQASQLRAAFINSLSELHSKLEKGEKSDFADLLQESADFFKP